MNIVYKYTYVATYTRYVGLHCLRAECRVLD